MNTEEKRKIETKYGNIEYLLERKRVKNVNFHVSPTGEVRVSASNGLSDVQLDQIVKKKAKWIATHQQRLKADVQRFHPHTFCDGDTFLLLGDRLELVVKTSSCTDVEREGNKLIVYVNIPSAENVKRILQRFFRIEATQVLESRFAIVCDRFKAEIDTPCTLALRKMSARWGSCNVRTHVITLNTKLVYAPVECIDYVITHELVHFKSRNHDDLFYAWLERLDPFWKRKRKRLNGEINTYCRIENAAK